MSSGIRTSAPGTVRCLRDSDQRPKRQAKNPGRFGSAAWPWQRSRGATFFITWSTCWPQPVQVVLPQVRQVVARHMVVPLRGGRGGQRAGEDAGAKSAVRLGSGATRFHGISDSAEAMARESLRAEQVRPAPMDSASQPRREWVGCQARVSSRTRGPRSCAPAGPWSGGTRGAPRGSPTARRRRSRPRARRRRGSRPHAGRRRPCGPGRRIGRPARRDRLCMRSGRRCPR